MSATYSWQISVYKNTGQREAAKDYGAALQAWTDAGGYDQPDGHKKKPRWGEQPEHGRYVAKGHGWQCWGSSERVAVQRLVALLIGKGINR